MMRKFIVYVSSLLMISSLLLQYIFGGVSSAYASTSTTISTPIKHIVVIFQENVSFDHYFGAYPNATNTSGEPRFTAAPHTPSVNGLTGVLFANNPNGNFSINPFRLDRSEATTCDMNHEYTAEQKAYHAGLLDKFVEFGSSTD